MQRLDLILALVIACLLWAVGSWYWYTCDIKAACENGAIQAAWIGGTWYQDPSEDKQEMIPVDEREEVSVRAGKSSSRGSSQNYYETTITCDSYLDSYIKYGADNYARDVRRLEQFLNKYEGENLVVDGWYSRADEAAVMRFQQKYASRILHPWGMSVPSGYVYTTTRDFINTLECAYEYAGSTDVQITSY